MMFNKKIKTVMKLSVISFIAWLLIQPDFSLAQIATLDQAPSCTCKPSPPGATTSCSKGQIAVCTVKGGICKGACITLNNATNPKAYFMSFSKEVFGITYSAEDLLNKKGEIEKLIYAVLSSNEHDEVSHLIYSEGEITFSISIPDEGVQNLKLFLSSLR